MFSKFLGSLAITHIKEGFQKYEVHHDDQLDKTKILVAPFKKNQLIYHQLTFQSLWLYSGFYLPVRI